MWPYFLLVFIIFILQFTLKEKDKKDLGFYIGIVILFLFAAFRGNGNGDYFNYLTRGQYIDTISEIFHNNTHMEIGYSILYYIVNILHLPKQCVIMGMNFISIACIAKFINRYSPYKCLSLLLFLPLYFQFDMHAARTAVAISISALSITYVYERKFLKFCFIIFAAMLFHQTAAAALLIYFFVNIHVNIFIGLASIFAGMAFVQWIGVDIFVLKILDWMKLESFYAKYNGYMKSELYGYRFSLLDIRLWLIIILFILAKIFCNNRDKLENLFVNCCFANAMSMILLSEHTFICYRLSAFFNVYIIIMVPIILSKFCNAKYYKNRIVLRYNRILAKGLVILFFTIYALAYVYTGFAAHGIEYRIFEIVERKEIENSNRYYTML